MSSASVRQLVDMGATLAQARHALKHTKDINEAASAIFSGKYDNIPDDDGGEAMDVDPPARDAKRSTRIETPPGDSEEEEEELEDDGEEEVFDYDSEPDTAPRERHAGADPYAGVFFSKDRREEVIEVEDTPETVIVNQHPMPLMTQGEWMKGCPEGGEQSLLFNLYSDLSSPDCPCPNACGHTIKRDKSLFFAVHPQFSDYVTRLRNSVQHKCPTCATQFCLACGERVDLARSKKPTYDPLFHCLNLQGAILGIGLVKIEQLYNDQTGRPSQTDSTVTNKKRKATPTEGEDDEEDEDMMPSFTKPKKAKGGVGYAGAVGVEDSTGHAEAMAQQKKRDIQLSTLMEEVRIFLPSLRREPEPLPSDYMVHPAALAHIRRRFNPISSSLLRNDSLTDMSDRSVLYFELFSWLETIAGHESLASMMGMPIMVIVSSTPLKPQASARRNQPAPRERTIVYEGSSGPRELMESIVIQAQAALKAVGGMGASVNDSQTMTEAEKRMTADQQAADTKGKGKEIAAGSEDNTKLRIFCDRIIHTAQAVDRSLKETKGADFVKRLHASLPKIHNAAHASRAAGSTSGPSSSSTPNANDYSTVYDDVPVGSSDEETQKNYVDWASRVRFEYCDLTIPLPTRDGPPPTNGWDDSPSYKHYFNGDIRSLANADIPKRSLAIAKELAVLTTNLPVAWHSSIFLRVDETRVDVLKALIIGPDGTPYQNGCYVFDIFLGANYNTGPPTVKYMTTNGGKFRFNPNLYADGKVCLSLLGTWSGPSWMPGKSTLLQVLISIQSMILCEEPYLNEPSFENSHGSTASKAYSANVRRMVIHTAMLGNIKAPPEPFADIIRTHFRLKAKSIEKQLDEWVEQDNGSSITGQGGEYVHPGSKVKVKAAAGGSGTEIKEHVAELKALLKKLNE